MIEHESIKEKTENAAIPMNIEATKVLFERMQSYPNTMHDYGITEKDLEEIEQNPKKYFRFALYLLSRNVGEDHVYENMNALDPNTAEYWLKEFMQKNIGCLSA